MCHERLDAATEIRLGDIPGPVAQMAPGDITFCVYCQTVLTVTETGLRLATAAEFRAVHATLRDVYGQLIQRSDDRDRPS